MRSFVLRHAALLALAAAASLSSCESRPAAGEAAATPATTPADSTAAPVATAAYICPMRCEGSASDKPGKCPVCEMELEANPAHQPAI